ncbi:hypothetical protein IL54_1164 [Sphingobium sp. ba1]|nr:hypothetical protein IL54_1164 [Sphingobium sp. ba1]
MIQPAAIAQAILRIAPLPARANVPHIPHVRPPSRGERRRPERTAPEQ